jgi:hypothetical protein
LLFKAKWSSNIIGIHARNKIRLAVRQTVIEGGRDTGLSRRDNLD